MTISENIFAALTAGSPAPVRAWTDVMPQYAHLPLITFFVVGGENDTHLTGAAGTRQRLVQVDAWGRTRIGVEELIEVAESQMRAASTFSVGAVSVSGAVRYEPGAGPGTDIYRESLEFSIRYET